MQKLASSSVAAIRRALRGRLERLVTQRQKLQEAKQTFRERLENLGADYVRLESVGQDDELSRLEEEIATLAAGVQLMQDEEPRLRELLTAAERVQHETKIEKILSIVETRFSGRSVVFFTEYKATQSLLMSELIRRFGDGCVGFINGENRADDVRNCTGHTCTLRQTKEAAAELFNEGRIRFLISTEAGGEGIDLQERCHSLLHVDLPWNPMRLHQRVGRLNRYGQKERVEVVTLRNPETVESRIWDKLHAKIKNIELAFGHLMDEPEDLLQMVLGMTSPSLFRELFVEAAQVPKESLGTWFDQRTATFGGRDVIATVKEIVGNCDRFDFQTAGKDVPPVDLPDLRPFLEAMLIQNRRRPRRSDDGSLSFKTPEAWLCEIGVRTSYEGLVFDRSIRGKDAVARVLGVGHKVIEQALHQSLNETSCVACVSSSVLQRPLTIVRVSDRVTGRATPVRSVVLAVERSKEKDAWIILRDWEVVRRLNDVVGNFSTLRTACTPSEAQSEVVASVDAAMRAVKEHVSRLDLTFKIPFIQAAAVIWPGTGAPQVSGAVSAAPDDLLD
jgi:hypothetical protein